MAYILQQSLYLLGCNMHARHRFSSMHGMFQAKTLLMDRHVGMGYRLICRRKGRKICRKWRQKSVKKHSSCILETSIWLSLHVWKMVPWKRMVNTLPLPNRFQQWGNSVAWIIPGVYLRIAIGFWEVNLEGARLFLSSILIGYLQIPVLHVVCAKA